MEQLTWIPLETRICFDAVISAVPGINGEFPKCIGRTCSKWEKCLCEVLEFNETLNEMAKRDREQKKGAGE